jgi:two-component system NtrC family sensor kinase
MSKKVLNHKVVADYRILSQQILNHEYHGLQRIDFLHEISNILLDFSGCDSIELWIKEHNKYYRYENTCSSGDPFHFGIIPDISYENEGIHFESEAGSDLERLCRDIVLRNFDPALPYFTEHGSFWTGETEAQLTFQPVSEKQAVTRKLKIGGTYKSIALIPIVAVNEHIGLLQLKSLKRDFFSKDVIEYYEGIAQTVGITLTHRRAHVALRERVKELTCLYSISKIVEQIGASMENVLREVLGLIPQAWLYPEIASARIILDGKSYSTKEFKETPYKQTSNIIVNGENRGTVEVVYSEKKPELDEGPFLKEERSLIDAIARELGNIILRKQTEDDKARLQEQLRHADRLATIGQLAAGVAHELNEPLGNILGFAQLVTKSPGLPDQTIKDIEKIVKASLHAREVIKKLMIFSRQMPTKKSRINLNQVIEDSLYFLESRCAKEGIKLVRLLASDMVDLTLDPSQITQVLVNLVVNAIQAMESGGTLTVKTVFNPKKYVSLIVEDTGIGMDEKVMKQIFIPFFTTKTVSQGTGLGLAVVHGIVTSHGGVIKVRSKIGQGSRFEIRLPVSGSLNGERIS